MELNFEMKKGLPVSIWLSSSSPQARWQWLQLNGWVYLLSSQLPQALAKCPWMSGKVNVFWIENLMPIFTQPPKTELERELRILRKVEKLSGLLKTALPAEVNDCGFLCCSQTSSLIPKPSIIWLSPSKIHGLYFGAVRGPGIIFRSKTSQLRLFDILWLFGFCWY